MQEERSQIPRAAFLMAGVAVGAAARFLSTRKSRRIADLESRLEEARAELERKMARLEARVEDHETRLNEAPSTAQIVAAMEGLLDKTLLSLDRRLSVQSESIELLKTTVSQTDDLLERVLESLDALRQDSAAEPAPERPSENCIER
jgi:glutathione S-transferase